METRLCFAPRFPGRHQTGRQVWVCHVHKTVGAGAGSTGGLCPASTPVPLPPSPSSEPPPAFSPLPLPPAPPAPQPLSPCATPSPIPPLPGCCPPASTFQPRGRHPSHRGQVPCGSRDAPVPSHRPHPARSSAQRARLAVPSHGDGTHGRGQPCPLARLRREERCHQCLELPGCLHASSAEPAGKAERWQKSKTQCPKTERKGRARAVCPSGLSVQEVPGLSDTRPCTMWRGQPETPLTRVGGENPSWEGMGYVRSDRTEPPRGSRNPELLSTASGSLPAPPSLRTGSQGTRETRE